MGDPFHNYLVSWQGQAWQNMVAGLLVALAMIPGAIAYALIAGISPTIGLMSTAMMMIGMSFLGSRTLMVSAPSSGVSVVAVLITSAYGQPMLITCMLIMACFQILFSFCRLDKVIKQIPVPVVIGFMNALAYLLLTSQFKHIFGHNVLTYVFAMISFLMLLTLPKRLTHLPASLVTIVLLTGIVDVFHLNLLRVNDFAQLHFVLPTIGFPDVELSGGHIVEMFIFGIMLALVATIQTSLTAQMVDRLTEQPSNLNHESLGQGLTNGVIALCGGLAGSALVGQSKYNIKLGATSRLSTFTTGIVMLFFLIVFGGIVGRIPMVVLAIILVRIAMNTFDRQTFRYLYERRWIDFTLMLLTFLLIVIVRNLALGVLVGTLCFYILKYFIPSQKGE